MAPNRKIAVAMLVALLEVTNYIIMRKNQWGIEQPTVQKVYVFFLPFDRSRSLLGTQTRTPLCHMTLIHQSLHVTSVFNQ